MKNKIFWIAVLLLMCVRFFYFGPTYYTYMDDNNQYGVYHLRTANNAEIINRYKAYNVRPLAFFTDIYALSPLWNNIWIAAALMMLLQFFIILMLKYIFDKSKIKFGPLAIVIFALSPFLFESTYWLSASSRIVVGTFLSVASIYIIMKMTYERESFSKAVKIIFTIFAILLNIMSACYYEQIVIFNFAFSIIILFLNREKINKYWFGVPIISTLIIGVWYITFSMISNLQDRGMLLNGDYINHTIQVLKLIKYNFIDIQGQILFNSFKLGIENFSWIIILLPILLIFRKEEINECNFNLTKFLLGLILLISPLCIHFILKDPMVYPRNMYISILGFALLIEIIVDTILNLIKSDKIKFIIESIVIVFISIWFMISSVGELVNYKNVNEYNNITVKRIIELIDKSEFDSKKEMIVVYDKQKLNEVSSNHFERNVEAGWSMMGIMQVIRQDLNIGNIICIDKEYFNEEMYDKESILIYVDGLDVTRIN